MEVVESLNKTEKDFGRRRHPRKEFKRDLGILYHGSYAMERAADISESGLSFFSNRELPVGGLVVLTFQIPGGAFVSVTAEIRGHFKTSEGATRTGCAYKNIRFVYKREIRNFVSSRE